MLAEYFPILLFILVGLGVGVAPLVLGKLLGPNRPDPEKLSPYECGFEAFEDARMKFDVRYYLVAILFILFDLEIAFLFPWAAVINEIGMAGFLSMMLFLAILTVGIVLIFIFISSGKSPRIRVMSGSSYLVVTVELIENGGNLNCLFISRTD